MGRRQQQRRRERELRRERMLAFMKALPEVPDTIYRKSAEIDGSITRNAYRYNNRYVEVQWSFGSFLLTRYIYDGLQNNDKAHLRCGDADKAAGKAMRWLLQGLR